MKIQRNAGGARCSSRPENRAYYNPSLTLKVEYGLIYLGLAVFLAVMTDATHDILPGTAGD